MRAANGVMTGSNGTLFEEAFANWNKIPGSAWRLALLAACLSASIDVTFWARGGHLSWMVAVAYLPISVLWTAAAYVGTLGIAHRPVSVGGYFRFLASYVAILIPLIAAIVFPLLAGGDVSRNVRYGVFGIGLLVGLLIVSLLPAWLVAQSLSARLISPLKIVRATRGHRWSLIGLSLFVSALGDAKLFGDIRKAGNVGDALLAEGGSVLQSLLTFAVAASVAATAWHAAARAEPDLGGSGATSGTRY